jgi:hypothetical protein
MEPPTGVFPDRIDWSTPCDHPLKGQCGGSAAFIIQQHGCRTWLVCHVCLANYRSTLLQLALKNDNNLRCLTCDEQFIHSEFFTYDKMVGTP